MEFDRQFATEESCRAYVMRIRWPEGFRCPHCGDAGMWRASRGRMICRECQHETWITAGTIFHRSHVCFLKLRLHLALVLNLTDVRYYLRPRITYMCEGYFFDC